MYFCARVRILSQHSTEHDFVLKGHEFIAPIDTIGIDQNPNRLLKNALMLSKNPS